MKNSYYDSLYSHLVSHDLINPNQSDGSPPRTHKPDILIHEKANRECYIIDVACPFDTRVKMKELEKVERYQDLKTRNQ